MKKLILLFALYPCLSWSTDGVIAVASDQNSPQLKLSYLNKDGFPTIVFSDGREARIVEGLSPKIRSYADLKQIENTCEPQARMAKCRLYADVARIYFGVRWSVHPDTNKIGQTIKVTSTISSTDPKTTTLESYQSYYFWYDSMKYKAHQEMFEPDILECDHDEWLQGVKKTDTGYIVDSWASESMVANPETGVDENTTDSAAYNLNLISVGQNKYTIGSMGSSYVKIDIFPPYLATQVNNMSYVAADGRTCQITFESNISQAVKDLGLLEEKVLPETIMPLQYRIKTFDFPIGLFIKTMLFSSEGSPKWSVE